MSWMCVLALTTCINTQGNLLPSDDVLKLLDDCQVAERFTVSDYKESDGAIWAELLYRDGLRFSRTDTAAKLRRNVLSACKTLERDFNNDAKWIPQKNRDLLWWVNQSGILLEIVGAALIVFAAVRNRKALKRLEDTWDGGALERLRDVVAGQAITEVRGFILLFSGLVFQLLGAFGG